MKNPKPDHEKLKHRLHEIIFEADTRPGKLFDIILIASIVSSVLVVMLDSVTALRNHYSFYFYTLEWGFTLLFTLEYFLRLFCVKKPVRYALSFFGIVDLLAILPTYASLIFPGSHYLIVIRILRVLRIFRIFKLVQYIGEASTLARALRASQRKIIIFLITVLTLVIIFGSIMYVIEGAENGFTSIPRSVYWAIVTLTTVGYGDISPRTNLGQVMASAIMILGYAIIAVPTGIVTSELSRAGQKQITTQACPECMTQDHDADAVFCKSCSARLNPDIS